jgi:hypothetical protein
MFEFFENLNITRSDSPFLLVQSYLGMQLDYSVKGKVKVRMIEYVSEMLEFFPQTFKENEVATMPASDALFNEGQGRKLHQERADKNVPHNGGKSPIPDELRLWPFRLLMMF